MATCPHGLAKSECLICRTLTTSDVRVKTEPSIPVSGQLLNHHEPRPRIVPRLLGGAVALLVVALLGWWLLGLVWAVLRIAELAAIGLGCAYLGYRVGVVSGRHQARH